MVEAETPQGAVAEAVTTDETSMRRTRRTLSIIALTLSAVFAPLSIVTVWSSNEVLDTDRYVENVAPLARDPEVQQAIANGVVNALFAKIDVQAVVKENLPPRAALLAGPITASIETGARRLTLAFVESDRFPPLWELMNRTAHRLMVKAITGGGDNVQVNDGRIVLDLQPVLQAAVTNLADRGFTFVEQVPLNTINLQFELFSVPELGAAQTAASLLDTLDWVTPIMCLGLLAAGLLLAPARRRRALIGWCLGTAGALLLLGVSINIGRQYYLNAVTTTKLPRDTAAAVFDTLVRFLRDGIRVVLVVVVITAVIAYLTGPSKGAVAVRGGLTKAGTKVPIGSGKAAGFAAQYRTALMGGGVALAGIVVLLAETPTPGFVLLFGIVLLVYLAGVWVLAGSASAAAVPGEEASVPEVP